MRHPAQSLLRALRSSGLQEASPASGVDGGEDSREQRKLDARQRGHVGHRCMGEGAGLGEQCVGGRPGGEGREHVAARVGIEGRGRLLFAIAMAVETGNGATG